MRIELSSVEFRYEDEPILQNVNLRIQPGSLTVICGQTGSGKSTLLQLIAGLESPNMGTVRYEHTGNPDRNARKRVPRERIAIVFQMPETQLFAGTVRQDIEYGLELRKVPKQERLSLIEEALRLVGLEPSDFLDRSPFLLSGGEKRRVAIAGALVLGPEVLILDEPTAGLDPFANRELLDVLEGLRAKGMTVIVATHDLDSFFPLADQVLVMGKGQVVFSGEAKELVLRPEILQGAGLELPSAARIAYHLRGKGIDVEIPLRVEELLPSLGKRKFRVASDEGSSIGSQSHASEHVGLEQASPSWNMNQQPVKSLLYRLDPRTKWFGMVSLSLASLSVTSGWGLAVSFGLVAVLFRFAQISWRKTWTFLRPFLIMFLFLFAVSAVTFSQADLSLGFIGISWNGALLGGLGVARFLLVILLGVLFTETTTGAPLREGFEWAIRPLRKLGVPTRDLSLAVSIALQFVPWILEEVGQLRKSLVSRGQEMIGIRKWTPRQISILIVPLLISILKMGDELATAIESRGYNKQVERTPWYQLRWTGKDSIACGLTALAAGFLWWLG